MSTLDKIFLVSRIAALLVLCGLAYLLIAPKWRAAHIQPGEVYSYTPEKDNPFVPHKPRYYRVLEVKDDYVLAIDSTYGDTMSQPSRIFIFGSEKIK